MPETCPSNVRVPFREVKLASGGTDPFWAVVEPVPPSACPRRSHNHGEKERGFWGAHLDHHQTTGVEL